MVSRPWGRVVVGGLWVEGGEASFPVEGGGEPSLVEGREAPSPVEGGDEASSEGDKSSRDDDGGEPPRPGGTRSDEPRSP